MGYIGVNSSIWVNMYICIYICIYISMYVCVYLEVSGKVCEPLPCLKPSSQLPSYLRQQGYIGVHRESVHSIERYVNRGI
jgi:hypothetical protein